MALRSKSQEPDDGEEEGSTKQGCNVPKTPVSLLQELYVRKGITPKYDLVQIEGAVHEPTFKYRVQVGDLVSTGCGQSKKKAKHSAAKAMIEKLKELSVSSQNGEAGESGGQSISHAVTRVAAEVPSLEVVDMLSPYDDGIPGNPVGELQELCMNRRMQPPIYTVSQEEGAPHERLFVMVCSVGGHHRETGRGKSKKLAKRQAAYKMLVSLKSMPADADESSFRLVDEDDLAQGIVSLASKNASRPDGPTNPFQQLNKFHRNLKLNRGVHLASLHSNESTLKPSEAKKLLEDISNEQDFIVTYVDVEEKSKDDKFHYFVQLSTTPVAVFYGVGDSAEEAQLASAVEALDYLTLMTDPKTAWI